MVSTWTSLAAGSSFSATSREDTLMQQPSAWRVNSDNVSDRLMSQRGMSSDNLQQFARRSISDQRGTASDNPKLFARNIQPGRRVLADQAQKRHTNDHVRFVPHSRQPVPTSSRFHQDINHSATAATPSSPTKGVPRVSAKYKADGGANLRGHSFDPDAGRLGPWPQPTSPMSRGTASPSAPPPAPPPPGVNAGPRLPDAATATGREPSKTAGLRPHGIISPRSTPHADPQIQMVRNIKALLGNERQMRECARQCFDRFDTNGDGVLSFEELTQCVRYMDDVMEIEELSCASSEEHEIENFMRRFDTDSKRCLSREQYENLYRHLLLISLHQHEPTPFVREMFVGRRMGSPADHYDMCEVLGHGQFGVVRKVQCKHTRASRAMKTIDIFDALTSGLPQRILYEEIDNLQTLDHPAILRLFEYFVDGNAIYLVTDLLTAGELLKYLKDAILQRRPPTERWVCELFLQVCEGIAYCHAKGVMHKDMKLDNVVLAAAEPPKPVVIDMGLAEIFPVDQADTFYSSTVAGNISTRAPEVIDGHFNYKCDVWSLGACLYGLLCKKPTAFRKPDGKIEVHPYPWIPPLERQTPEELEKYKAMQAKGPNLLNFHGSVCAQDLVGRMLTFDEHQRPAMKDVILHSWFREFRDKDLTLNPDQLECLLQFHHTNALENAVLVDVASQLPIGQLKDLVALFESMDRQGTGMLGAEDLSAALAKAGLEAEVADRAAQHFTRDGPVEFSKFIAALLPSRRALIKQNLRDAFNRLDTDGSGFITQEELQSLLAGSELKELQASEATQRIFDALGGCRRITFSQFTEYFNKFSL